MSTLFNENIVKCAECGCDNPKSSQKCWSCENPLTYRNRWRVGCYYCSKTMDFIWGGSKPVRKEDLDYMICSPDGEDCNPDGESTFETTLEANNEN
jgi:hypothetical protein